MRFLLLFEHRLVPGDPKRSRLANDAVEVRGGQSLKDGEPRNQRGIKATQGHVLLNLSAGKAAFATWLPTVSWLTGKQQDGNRCSKYRNSLRRGKFAMSGLA
ncbi:hypothetical protein [Mesorhizobium erdmanii]|uniref:hypothetical protein n=1 Tax=Mesorhizobium erdmanii TaxID=1777866 RepID=UPI001FD75D57|nr:hypothetical protein [Mesorhizobium erdmanii]